MACWHYHYFGLRVASEMPIPEWSPFAREHPFTDPEVWIRSARPTPHAPEGAQELPRLDAEEYHFHVPDTGRYWVRNGREIFVHPAPQAHDGDVRLFLLGSAWGALCYQRGLLVLHASVVQAGAYAAAFCGASGAGKSSTAAWLTTHGYRLVSDDLCRIDPAGGALAHVYPSAPRLKLWRDALVALQWRTDGLQRDHTRADKFHVPSGGNTPPDRLPLRGLYLLEWGAPGLVRLRGAQAVRRLVANATYRGALLQPMGHLPAYWEACAELARRVPIWTFARPREWTAAGAALDRLAASLQDPPCRPHPHHPALPPANRGT